MWAGLGYYRRARFLLQGARHVRDQLRGQFPLTSAELQKLPGGSAVRGMRCCQGEEGGEALCQLPVLHGLPRRSAAAEVCLPRPQQMQPCDDCFACRHWPVHRQRHGLHRRWPEGGSG